MKKSPTRGGPNVQLKTRHVAFTDA